MIKEIKYKKGQSVIYLILMILIVILVSFIVFIFFRGQIGLMVITSNTILEFPTSNSPVISEINKTYIINEDVVVNASFKKKPIINETYIEIDGKNIPFEIEEDNKISFILDTLIRNKDSKETKLITIHGRTIEDRPFLDEENYQIIVSSEEFLIEKVKNSEKLAVKSNKIAVWALIFAVLSIIINIIQFSINKRKKR